MKKRRVIMFIIAVTLITFMIFIYWIYQNNKQKKMDYKFDSDKLYVTINSKDWIEVPFDFSYTINHLNEVNNGKYKEGTYQLNNKKIVFYFEKENTEEKEILDKDGKVITRYKQYDGKYILGIVYSDDKGKTWKNTVIGTSDYNDMLVNIMFKNSQKGEMTLNNRANNGTYNYVTENGGDEWLIQYDADKEISDVKARYKLKLEGIPRNLTVNEAVKSGYFVYDGVQNKVYNKDILDRFVKNTEMNATERIADEIIIVIYTIDGKPYIYDLGYKYTEKWGYVLAKDPTRIDIFATDVMMDVNEYKRLSKEYSEITVNYNLPSEHYGITVTEDTGISAGIISLTSYSEEYEDIEIGRYMLDAEIVENTK